MNKLELLLHPVRLRIIHAMSGDRTRTTAELCATLPDVSKATVYRHVSLLVEGGLLDVVGERRVHGAVERRYRLHPTRLAVGRDEAAGMSLDDHRQGFAAAIAALVADFNAYLDRPRAEPAADSVSYAQVPMWLNRDELRTVVEGVRSIIKSGRDNLSTPDRSQYLFSPILFPIEELPGKGIAQVKRTTRRNVQKRQR
jgi:DNA-binding transcriptional ArsR family regulator